MVTAERRYKQKRLNALKGQNLLNTQRLKGVFVPLSSNEAKTQANGIHMHMIWLCSEAPDAHQLKEWEALTGDSFIVDVRPMYGEIDGLS